MPKYIEDLTATAAIDADTLFHVARNVSGVFRDRKISKTDLFAALAFALTSVAGKYRFKVDGSFQLYNATQSKYHTISISGSAGAEQIDIGAGEV